MSKSSVGLSLFFLVSVTIAAGIGYYLGQPKTIQSVKVVDQPAPSKPFRVSPLVRSQNATIQGTIIDSDSSSISVRDNKGQTDKLPLSSSWTVSSLNEVPKAASKSAAAKKITTNQEAIIVMDLIDGEYKVTAISYIPKALGESLSVR